MIYRSRNDVRWLFVELVDNTPLESNSPVLKGHDEMIQQYRSSPGVFWSLAAAVDLAPLEPTTEELGPMTIGQATPAATPRWFEGGSP